jgi:transcriptional regulator with XRE-family HTH domain
MATRLAAQIGKNLAFVRRERRLTQAEVAERIDVDAETISRFERGFVTPSIATLERLCAALDCRWSDLLEGVSSASQQLGPEIARLLEPLSPDDRLFVLAQVKTWSEKLGAKAGNL